MRNRALVQLGSFAWSFGILALVLPSFRPQLLPPAESIPVQPEPLPMAVAILSKAERFSSAGVGYAGVASNELLAWRVIFYRPDADSVFQHLLRTASLPGQLYALAGLRFSNSTSFEQAARVLEENVARVETVRGCIVGSQTVAQLVKEIQQGDWVREFIMGRWIPREP